MRVRADSRRESVRPLWWVGDTAADPGGGQRSNMAVLVCFSESENRNFTTNKGKWPPSLNISNTEMKDARLIYIEWF